MGGLWRERHQPQASASLCPGLVNAASDAIDALPAVLRHAARQLEPPPAIYEELLQRLTEREASCNASEDATACTPATTSAPCQSRAAPHAGHLSFLDEQF